MKVYTTQVVNASQFSYRFERVISAVVLLAMICVSTTPSLATATVMVIDLTEDGLDLKRGNYGTSLSINEDVQISAVTHIGQHGGPLAGTIYLNKGNKGLGVRTLSMGGSKGISGGGDDDDEMLVFNFTGSVKATSVLIGLNRYRDRRDDTIIRLLSGDVEYVFDKSDLNWDEATTSLGRGKIVVDIGLLLTEGFTGLASSLSITETTGHIFVNSIAYSTPEPTTICILGMGALVLFRKRRK